jgi:hypothetical protein
VNKAALYAKTGKGLMQVRHRSRALSPEAHGLLAAVDGRATLSDLERRLSLVSVQMLEHQLQVLSELGFIKEISWATRREGGARLSLVEPPRTTTDDAPAAPPSPEAGAAQTPAPDLAPRDRTLPRATLPDPADPRVATDTVLPPADLSASVLSHAPTSIDLQKDAPSAVMAMPEQLQDPGSSSVQAPAEAEFMGDIEQLIQREMARQGLLPASRPDEEQPPAAPSAPALRVAQPGSAALDEVEARLEALLAGMGSSDPEPAPVAARTVADAGAPPASASPARRPSEDAQRDALSRLVLSELDAEDEPPVQELLAPVCAEPPPAVTQRPVAQAAAARPAAAAPVAGGGLALEEEQLRREIAEIEQRSRMEEAARQAVAQAEAEAAARAQAEVRTREAAARRATEQAARQAREDELRRADQEKARREAEQARRSAEAAAAVEREALARRRAEQERMEGERIKREQALAQMRAQIAERERERSAERRAEAREEPVWWKGSLARAGAMLLVLAFLLGGLQFLSLPFVGARLESALSQRIGDTVSIGGVRVSLVPAIELRLDQVVVGKGGEVRADVMRLRPEPGTIFGDVIRMKRVVLEGASADVGSVPAMLRWFPVTPERRHPEFDVIELLGARLGVPGIELPPLDGEFHLAADGRLVNGRMATADGAVKAMFQPGKAGLEIGVLAHAWTPLLGPKVVLDEFQAEALLAGGRLRVRSFTGVFNGGVMKGWGDVEWARGWVATGDYTLERIDARGMLAAAGTAATASGVLEARGGFSMKADALANLFSHMAAWGEFTIRGGALHGVDLPRALQAAPGAALRGGQTKFDQLRGSFSLNPGRVLFRDLRLQAGALEASGAMEVGDALRVRGHAVAELRNAARPFRTDLSLGGQLSELTLTP